MPEAIKKREVVLRLLADLHPHEETKPARLDTLLERFRKERIIDLPVIVDRATGVIIDGHHRVSVLRILGAKLVPCVEVEYLTDEVTLTVRPESGVQGLSKEDILATGLSSKIYPHKTTKHLFGFDKTAFPPTPIERLL